MKILYALSFLLWSCFTLSAQNVNIPDANFKSYLISNSLINTNLDGEIQVSEAEAFTGNINVYGDDIADLTGIDAFINLTQLYVGNNSLSSIDISANTKLTRFACNSNDLTSLDVSNNTALNFLRCDFNQLTTLDVSNNTNLTVLETKSNLLTALDVSNNTALQQLQCQNNDITMLDISNNVALKELDCSGNELTSLDVSNNAALTSLRCNSNGATGLTSLNVANGNNENLVTFYAAQNPNLSCIEVDDATYSSNNWSNDVDATASFSENCSSSPCIVNIPDANFKAKLVAISGINTNEDEEIQCSEAEAFTGSINVNNGNISDMTGIEAFINLTYLDCGGNDMTSIDLSQNTKLEDFRCVNPNNPGLSSLDVTNNIQLTHLNVKFNNLTALDLSKNTLLVSLLCDRNDLTTMDLSNNTLLERMDASYNQLNSIDFSNNQKITRTDLAGNNISSIDVTGLSDLEYLSFYENNVTSIDVSNQPNLVRLWCWDNAMEGTLNILENPNITQFSADQNPNLEMICVSDVSLVSQHNYAKDDATFWSENCVLSTDETVSMPKKVLKTYNLQGIEVSDGTKGAVILQYSDGTTQKVFQE